MMGKEVAVWEFDHSIQVYLNAGFAHLRTEVDYLDKLTTLDRNTGVGLHR
jgi:hypothetical protein